MTQILRIQRDVAALEAFAVSDVGGLFKRIVPTIFDDISNFFKTVRPEDQAVELPKDHKKFLELIKHHRYIDLTGVASYVPEGLEVTYDEYLVELDKSVERIEGLVSNVLNPFSAFLAGLVTNKEAQLSTFSFNATNKGVEKEREALLKDLGECFGKGRTQTNVTYGDVVKRNQDWESVLTRTIVLTGRVNHIDRRVIQKKIAECSQLLETIYKKLQRGEFENVTPEVVQNFADGAYQVARELEFYSTTVYRVHAYTHSVKRTIEYIGGILDPK